MAAEDSTPGESSDAAIRLSRRQFSLPSLFFFILFISPLLLSLNFVREQLAGSEPDYAMGYRVLALAVIYAGVFAARGEIRRRGNLGQRRGMPDITPAAEGGAYGVLFAVMALGPVQFVGILQRNGMFALGPAIASAGALFLFAECLWEFLLVTAITAFYGLILGVIGGYVGGSAIKARRDRRANHSS